ncbi:MAG: preprotein translocase subunit SecE [Caulobacteraceae bacterium]
MAKSKAPIRRRQAATTVTASAGAVAARAETHAPKPRTSPVKFFREVRAEARKISWPSRRETWITSVMVFIMVAVTTVFFWVLDFGLSNLIRFILQLPTMLSS